MKRILSDLCREFIGNVEEIVREQVKQEVLFAIEQPSRAAARREAKIKNAKRSTVEIDSLAANLRQKVRDYPGSTIERLGTFMNRSTPALRLPMIRLIDAGKVRKEGHHRMVRYYPVDA